ncbi:MAG: hypothetical protein EAZ65_09050 [Verrucomicrobia bacterium]|nr:MAG: hypothetical protein EAZ84_13025 [Verrucomicrobiota bacterium]TAE86109.1 MAG: hypothetical protein EAZ82_12095 [Verrucomicrobiota bacterium]TAF23456.1 MAG: hypothetical protein EAZ71_12680 [Verrucomicrobiota bacterium]TAF40086.1 MAG: hypothetical protein EAZ65_09050 [Verrucomicrobiota bacterium]
MNRLVRIAVTLFASASILIFLVLQRLERAKSMNEIAAAAEQRMALIGIGITGFMLLAGLSLIITALIRARKKSSTDG